MSRDRITSRQNPRVKDAMRLRTGRGRRRQGRFIVEGTREIERALAVGIRPLEAFVSAAFEPVERSPLLESLRAAGAEMFIVTPEVFARLCFGDRDAAGVLVVAETPTHRLDDIRLPAHPLVAVVEGVEKPGNLGAILRSADAAGVDAVVVADGGTDLFNPNTIRSSLGTAFRPNVVEAATGDVVAWIRRNELRIIAARPDASAHYTAADFRGRVAIVLGSEAAGLSDVWRNADMLSVHLPMHGMADSLNVSTTAAVLFYEALRQRDEPKSRDGK